MKISIEAIAAILILAVALSIPLSLGDCKTPPAPVEQEPVTISKALGCEQYRERARAVRDMRKRGEIEKLYKKCRARVIELAGKYEIADVRRVATKKKRDGDYLDIRTTFCMFHGAEKLPKCFVIPERRWAPSAWSMFWKDAARVAGGAVAGFLAGKYAFALWWLL